MTARTSLSCLLAILLLSAPLVAQENPEPETPTTEEAEKKEAPAEPPVIEIAILLDTSGSMDGLINQARARLWDIVNNLALARKDGQMPNFRVALYEYGKQSEPAENGFIRQIVPLTDDLDKVAEELFALTTNGGEEFCGAVIDKAVDQLEWSEGDHFRAIFIAGNERFTQGPTEYQAACQKAIEAGIVVNTIHCGPESKGKEGKWQHAALIADGEALNIDQERVETALVAPQDEKLAELSKQINKTYLAFGDEGKKRAELQRNMDEQTEEDLGAGGSAQRAMAKGGRLYKNSTWDLIDAFDEKKIKWEDLEEKDLPEEMRDMTLEERKAYLAEKKAEREAIQAEIKKLSQERRKFIAEERKKQAEEGSKTFGAAVKEALGKQLAKKDYQFED